MAAVENAYMKQQLVRSNAARVAAIESGEQVVVGVNKFLSSEPSPLTTGDGGILTVDPAVEEEQKHSLDHWRQHRDAQAVQEALRQLESDARAGRNIMPASIQAAKAGVTTGEWGQMMRDIFGNIVRPQVLERMLRPQKMVTLPICKNVPMLLRIKWADV